MWVCVLGIGVWLRPAIPGLGVWVFVFVCALHLYPANPGWGSSCVCLCSGFGFCPANRGRDVGVCVFVCALCMYPANAGWSVGCGGVCLRSGFECAKPFLAGVQRCVCSSAEEKRRTRPQPRTGQKRQQGSYLPTPSTPSGPPDQPGVRPGGPPPRPVQASPSSSLPPHASPQPKTYPQYPKGTSVRHPFRNDHTGDCIWCEGTIQYRRQDPGPNGGVQIWVTWYRQKELNLGSSAPYKPLGDTLELNGAHPI